MNHFPVAGLALALLGVQPAHAETVTTTDSSLIHDLDEVVVIRQPKEQYRLRLQPVSSSMFSANDVRQLGVRDLRELSSYVPNFTMPDYGSRYTSAMYVRGIGSRVNSPAVGIYVDGVPLMSKSAFNTHIYGLSRADVLRGAQGTLYGLNSEGGLVRLYTLNPMDYQGTDLSVGGGSHFYRNVELAHYQKLNDKFAFSVAGFYNGQNGFFRNQFDGQRADRYNEAGSRLKFVFRPAERWDISFMADYQYVNQNGFPYGQLDADGLAQNPNTNDQGRYRRNLFNTALNLNFRANAFDFSSTSSYQYLKDYMLMDIDYLPQDFMRMEERQLQSSFTQELTLKSRRPVGGFWRWTLGAFGGFTWLRTGSMVFFDQDMDHFLGSTIRNAMYNAMVKSMAGRFMAVPGTTPEQAAAMAAQAIEHAGGVTLTVDMRDVPGLFHTPTYNVGFYHESNLDITKRLVATIGLRYDYDYARMVYNTSASMYSLAHVMGRQAAVTVSSLLAHRQHQHFDQLLPKFGLTYRVDEHGSNVYATVTKGYRAGGYNIQMFSDILQTELQNNSSARVDLDIAHSDADYANIDKTISFKPETSWNYEFGTHLNLFGNRVHFDFTGFYMQVRNQQLSVMAGNYGFGRMMTNAGKSYSCGVETSLRGQAFDNRLSWAVSYGYVRSVFKDYVDSVSVNGAKAAVDYKDKRVPFVPEHTFAASADYRFVFARGLMRSMTLGANVYAQGRTYWDEANTSSQNLYAVLGAHVGLDFGKFTVNIWGRNLTDSKYNVFAVNSAASGKALWSAQRGNPLQFGADLKLHF